MIKTHGRVFVRRLKSHAVKYGWIWLSVFLMLSLLTHFYHPAINRTHSLPFSLFVIERGTKDVSPGDYVAFEPKASAVGGYRLTFVKEVVCAPGQTLSLKNRELFCDGKFIARAKTHSMKGEPLEVTQAQVLGEDQYFVRGTHPDSFDSRYERFGLINRCRFVGRAHPVF